jgi:hypothetical protein
MRRAAAALILIGAMVVAGEAAGAAWNDGAGVQSASGSKSAVSLGAYAIRGIVRAVNGASLVIAPSSKRSSEMSFVLRPSTQCEGAIVVGATVSVRYVKAGDTLVATAVFAHPTMVQRGNGSRGHANHSSWPFTGR